MRRNAPSIVLSDTSPYGSRSLVVESDGTASAAYLRDRQGTTRGAAWLGNHRPAPAGLDRARLDAGMVPLLPAGHTSHPAGRAPLDPSALEVVWFEEGGGAALLEDGEPLGVIPEWSDMATGVPGHSRDATTEGPFALPLDDRFEARIQGARGHWAWRGDPAAWADFQQSALGHLLARLGPGGQYWHDVGQRIGLSERPALGGRVHQVLSTVGMSCQRMPSSGRRIELAVACGEPAGPELFQWLASYPWREMAPLAPGKVVAWDSARGAFPLGDRWAGVLLLADPARLAGPPIPDLSGFRFGSEDVRWLWIVPITADEAGFAASVGSTGLFRRLVSDGRSWIASR
jgi:Suppressor of fused protein (SUFU)